MSLIEFQYEDFSRSGRTKLKKMVFDAYDIEPGSRIEWPRPMLTIEAAAFEGLTLVVAHSGDEVTFGDREVEAE